MKTCLPALFAALAVAGPGLAADKDESWTALFNGRDLTGWKVVFRDKEKDADPAKTFTVKDAALIVSGKPTCYIHTEKSYSNYVLSYEWRFPEGSSPKSNSGCLVHIQPPPKVMPKSVEPQGRYEDHGKLFFIGGVKPVGEPTFDADAQRKALKPMGEWSTTEVTCKADGSIVVKLNGVQVSQAKTELTEGPIGFQCEGFEVHFRNIRIKEVK
jgi:3-keto-disaccharide hydrolase